MPTSGPTQGAARHQAATDRWESRPWRARLLRALIHLGPIVLALVASILVARVAPPDRVGINRWWWTGAVFVLVSGLLSVTRRLLRHLTPLAALMELTLVFPDQAPSRRAMVLRRSSSRSMLREIRQLQAEGDEAEKALHGPYLVQLLAELNDHDRLTRGHSERVRAYSELLGEELGLSDDEMDKLRWAALLHDVGKLTVPSEILNKDGRPTDDEWAILSGHPGAATRILEPLRPWLGDWIHAADQHHCRWDGGGYPFELAGDDISLAGRLVAVADAYDVMTSARSYKKPLSPAVARKELTDCAGSQFDPRMVRAFLGISLGRLRNVAGPFAGLAHVIAPGPVPVPLATTAASGAGTVATALGTAVLAGAGSFAPAAPPDPPETLALDDQVEEVVEAATEEPIEVAVADVEVAGREDEPVVVSLTATGGSGTLSFRWSQPERGEVAPVSGQPIVDSASGPGRWQVDVEYRPDPDVNGDDRFGFTACDERARCADGTVSVSIDAVNDPPVAVDDRYAIGPERSATFDVLANDSDPEDEELRLVDVVGTSRGQAVVVDDDLLYAPPPGYLGSDRLAYTVADASGARSQGIVEIEIALDPADEVAPPPVPMEPANLFPLPEPDRATTDEDTPVVIDVLANDTDPEGVPLTIVAVGDPSLGQVELVGDQLRYTPDPDRNGDDAFAYSVSDGANQPVAALVDVSVFPAPDAPRVSAPASVTVAENAVAGTVIAAVEATDPDGDALDFAVVSGDPSSRFAIDGAGQLTVDAPLDRETTANYLIEVEVSDGVLTTATTIEVIVSDVNEAPAAVDDLGAGFTTDEDTILTTASVLANDSDVDDPLDPGSIAVVAGPTNGSLLDNGDGTFTYDPDPDWSGTDGFTYRLTDARGAISNLASVELTVDPVNDAPQLVDPGAQVGAVDTPFSLQLSASDPELDTLAYSVTGLPSGLSVDSNGSISGTPGSGAHGVHNVTIRVTDNGSPPASTPDLVVSIDIGWHVVSSSAGEVVINEILYETVSTTAPEEFVELHNRSGSAVDLTGWTLADSNLKIEGFRGIEFTVPATDHWGTASSLAPGERAVIWLVEGANPPPYVNTGAGLEYSIGTAGAKLISAGDDLWLLDPDTAVVDFVAWGSGSAVQTPPEPGLGLWDDTHQASLASAGSASIALTPNGNAPGTSACWEATGSGAAAGRCPGALATNDSDSFASLATSVGFDNNAVAAVAGGPYAIAEGDPLTLDGSGSAGATTWAWDLDNDGGYDDAVGSAPVIPWSGLVAAGIDDDGTYPVGLQVDGAAVSSASVTVSNTRPTLATTGSATTSDGASYTLNLSATDPGADTITGWTINWGDGTVDTIIGNPSSVTHTYVRAGLTYDVLASATDEDGTHLQNELLVPSYDGDEVFRFAATTGAFVDSFATVDQPTEVLVGPDGQVYVSGDVSDDVRRYTTAGVFVDDFIAAGTGGLSSAQGMAFGTDGNLYVGDWDSDRILRFDASTGNLLNIFATSSINGPYAVIVGTDGHLYVGNFSTDEVLRFNGLTGTLDTTFVTSGDGGLDTPEGIVFGPDGNFYVASFATDQVLRYDGSTGAFIDVFVDAGGLGDLDEPTGLAFGPDGHLYVGDFLDDAVLRFDGSTGTYIDDYVGSGVGGLTQPALFTFLPGHQVRVTP